MMRPIKPKGQILIGEGGRDRRTLEKGQHLSWVLMHEKEIRGNAFKKGKCGPEQE